MSEQTAQKPSYMVSIHELMDDAGALIFTFVPGDHQPKPRAGETPNRVPRFVTAVSEGADGLKFDWSKSPDAPEAAREEIEAEIRDRMTDRAEWIDRVHSLLNQVEQWAREMGWSTRRVEKKLDDKRIGAHRVPALLMQEDTFRVLLEPLGRTAPGVEGVVDFYLMPAYDDIASIYHYEGDWHLHYPFPGAEATVRETEASPLSKDLLEKVLAEMIQHAA